MRRVNSRISLVCLVIVAAADASTTWAQSEFASEVKLTASDGGTNDNFGFSVAISGNTAIVGAHRDDDNGSSSGSAYIYQRDEGGADHWGEIVKLTASDASLGDDFGFSVAISGDTVVVGAYRDDFNRFLGGSAYIYQRDEGGPDNWGEVVKITASDRSQTLFFGSAVAISGDTVVVADHFGRHNGVASGSAYVYERNEGGADNWGEVTKIVPSTTGELHFFGDSLALDADTLVVGARLERVEGEARGAAYLFQRDHGGIDNWGEVTKFTASKDAIGSQFGTSVAISYDTVIVTSRLSSESAPFVHVYRRNAGGTDNWGEVGRILWSNADTWPLDIAITGDKAVLPFAGTGAGYVYQRDEGGPDNWGEVSQFTTSDSTDPDFFGMSVATSGNTTIVGAAAYFEKGGFGSAYVYFAGQCIDNDGDGYGFPSNLDCPNGAGGDCDDNDPDVFPGHIEICGNGLDDNCDGKPDCDDGDECNGIETCDPQTGGCFVGTITDCNENDIADDCDLDRCRGDLACDDCDNNGIPDGCDLAAGGPELNGNGILDRCEPPCADAASCDDSNDCSSDRCIDSLCFNTVERIYGDVAGLGGMCGPDGDVDLRDILAVLDAFSGIFYDGCELADFDLSGPQSSCTPDNQIDLSDILAILDAFSGLRDCCAGPE